MHARSAVGIVAFVALACGTNEDATGAGGTKASGGVSSGGVSSGGVSSGGVSSGGVSSGGTSAGTGGNAGSAPTGPTRYPPAQVKSPLTAAVAERLRAIAKTNATRKDDVFMKVGDSHTVNKNFFYCFAGATQPGYTLDLDGRDTLTPSIEFFRGAKLASSTPFDHVSHAAEVGRSASWAISGSPSPLEQEIAETNPRFSLVMYGTNDMQMGLTYESAIFPFYSNLSALLDQVESAGIVPIVSGLLARGDSASAAFWVPAFDAVTRGIAEAHQVPYISLYQATRVLPKQGLGSDILHANVFVTGGVPQPCELTAAGLDYGYNVRNLETISVLDAVKRVVVDAAPPPDVAGSALAGDGSPSAPFVIDTLPFVHALSTKNGSHSIDKYTGCGATQDESGPERFYSLTIEQPTSVRVLLFDRNGVDVDLHLLAGGSDGSACIARDDRAIHRALEPGKYQLVVDSFVSSSNELSGDYMLVVLACDPSDASCN